MYYLVNIMFGSMLLILLGGCGGRSSQGIPPANQASVDDLSALLTNHPELSRATLNEIKVAAVSTHKLTTGSRFKSKDTFTAIDVSDSGPKKRGELNEREMSSKPARKISGDHRSITREVAVKAQDLVDDILDNMDFEASFDAETKLAGIQINEVAGLLDMMKSSAFANKLGDKGHFMLDKFGGDKHGKTITCEDLVNDPFIRFARDQHDRAMRHNKYMIKESLSGCPEITSKQFVDCMQNFNKLTGIINEYASCGHKSIREMEKQISKELGINYGKLEYAVERCFRDAFAACGFNKSTVDESMSNDFRTPVSETGLNSEEFWERRKHR